MIITECRNCGLYEENDTKWHNYKSDETGNKFCPECDNMLIITEFE